MSVPNTELQHLLEIAYDTATDVRARLLSAMKAIDLLRTELAQRSTPKVAEAASSGGTDEDAERYRNALAQLIKLDDLGKEHAKAFAACSQQGTDAQYIEVDRLATAIAKLRPEAWAAAREAIAANGNRMERP